ncbi:threonine/homoserine/homoserine lactone efflux protein [Roseiarcus fermentans]|uniref:Threonine/homoserine/homoserine lactone efflux protein n=1 Tax=Roseiarcus fermentans TaxID=1473586 RepID=A0A366EV46_9HYPH|nr:LysE family translocator [Roseiarcus fermentans]RBP06271.1 threonine/homoserine/homoserine lactone efflux protein [Roseiarcus fermentans]
MTPGSLLLFAAVYFAAVATPGPGLAALVARVLAYGLVGVAPFILGYVVGDMIWLLVAGTGLAALANAFAGAFTAVKYAGAAYLLYLAWRTATAPAARGEAPPPASRGARAFLGSLSLTLGNPKVMVFFLSIMPLVVDVKSLTAAGIAVLLAISIPVIAGTLAAYALAANRARALFRSAKAMRIAHRTAAGVMAGVAVAVATR